MPFLLDPEAEVIREYGVYNEQDDRSLPHPTALVIDREGIVRYVRIDVTYRERPSVDELVEALASIQ